MRSRTSRFRGLCIGSTVFLATLAGAEEGAPAAPVEGAESSEAQTKPDAPSIDPDVETIVILEAKSEPSTDFSVGDSVTGFGAEDLAALGAQDVADLASFTPNLEIVTAGATTPTFFIRGVGLNDFNPNSTGAVAIYRDGVAINAPAIQLATLFDVQAVNVLRGPQGTGLARNASAGAIKIYSRKPTGDFGGFLRADFGDFGYQDYEGALEVPLHRDVLATRLAFRLSKRDGTMKNRCGNAAPPDQRNPYELGGIPVDPKWSICGEPVSTVGQVSTIPVGLEETVNNLDNWAARGTLLFEPTLEMSWLLSAHGSRRDEVTRLGQAIGTGSDFCTDPTKVCNPPFAGVPPELRDRAGQSGGLLGGPVNGDSYNANYVPREIRQRLNELAPCVAAGTCQQPPVENRLAFNLAKIQLAEELARQLDSEPWEGDFDHTGPTSNDTYGGYLEGDIRLPWDIDFTTTTGYDAYERLVDIDLDFSPETLFHIETQDESWQVYQGLSFEGRLGDASQTAWEVGGYLLREELGARVQNDLGDVSGAGVLARDYSQNFWSAAGYVHFSHDFRNDLTLDGGVRYNWEQKDFDMVIFSVGGSVPEGCEALDPFGQRSRCELRATWQAPTGTIRLTYAFREDTHAYGKYTRGWKPGTFNATASQFTGPTSAEPETIDSFETGLRGSWFDGRLGMDAALFYYAYSNYQIFTAQQFLGGNPEFVILNANDAEVYGAELDAQARPWEGGYLNLRFHWLESQFLDFVKTDQFLNPAAGASDTVVFKQTQNSGNPLPNSPRFKISLTGEQTVPIGRYGSVTLRYDGVWTDKTFYDPSAGSGLGDVNGDEFLPDDTIAQVAFWLHNLRLSWRSPSEAIEIAGWVRNLENEGYKTFAFDGSTFRQTTIYFVGDPRTIGASLVVNF
jgi:outer membrane receptor protein involved in Fe transport